MRNGVGSNVAFVINQLYVCSFRFENALRNLIDIYGKGWLRKSDINHFGKFQTTPHSKEKKTKKNYGENVRISQHAPLFASRWELLSRDNLFPRAMNFNILTTRWKFYSRTTHATRAWWTREQFFSARYIPCQPRPLPCCFSLPGTNVSSNVLRDSYDFSCPIDNNSFSKCSIALKRMIKMDEFNFNAVMLRCTREVSWNVLMRRQFFW